MPLKLPITALLTPPGRGAVATIAYRGDVAVIDAAGLFVAANGKPLAEQPINRVVYGRWGEGRAFGPPIDVEHDSMVGQRPTLRNSTLNPIDEDVVVCRTADDELEIHCHGGAAATARVLEQVKSLGATVVPWREYIEVTAGAFAADVHEALAGAATSRAATIIVKQATGPLKAAWEQLSSHLSRDSHPSSFTPQFSSLLKQLDRNAEFGRHLTRPWRVVLYGPPNVGKSSLINSLVGYERSIVYDVPGTTRDVVTAETAYDGWPLHFSDTAGLREARPPHGAGSDPIEAAGMDRAKAMLAAADLRVLVLDRNRPREIAVEAELASLNPDLVVMNKSDLPDAYGPPNGPPSPIDVSAKTGDGVRSLLETITQSLVPAVPPDDEPVPVTDRQIDVVRAMLGKQID